MLLYAMIGTCSLAPHILLEHIGAPFEVNFLDRDRGENKDAAYLAVNPKGKVPTLSVDDGVVVENVAIQMYLADRFAELSLAPTEPLQRARWMAALSWMSNAVHVSFRHFRRPEMYTSDETGQPHVSAIGKRDFIEAMQELDTRLDRGPWLLGEVFSTADVYAHVFHVWAARAQFPIQHLHNLRRHGQAMMAMPATLRAMEREGLATDLFK